MSSLEGENSATFAVYAARFDLLRLEKLIEEKIFLMNYRIKWLVFRTFALGRFVKVELTLGKVY